MMCPAGQRWRWDAIQSRDREGASVNGSEPVTWLTVQTGHMVDTFQEGK